MVGGLNLPPGRYATDSSLCFELHLVLIFLLLSVYFYCTWCTEKHKGKIICMYIHSLFCELNFMLSACRPYFSEVACTTQKVEQSLFRGTLEIHKNLCQDNWCYSDVQKRHLPTQVCHVTTEVNLLCLYFWRLMEAGVNVCF